MRRAPPLGLGVRLTLPCGWNNAGKLRARDEAVRQLRAEVAAAEAQALRYGEDSDSSDGGDGSDGSGPCSTTMILG